MTYRFWERSGPYSSSSAKVSTPLSRPTPTTCLSGYLTRLHETPGAFV